MKTLRFKIFCSYFLLLILFLGCMFPFVTNSVQRIVLRSMSDRAEELIEALQDSKSQQEVIQVLKDHKYLVFFRIALFDSALETIYDSHTKRVLGIYVSAKNQEKNQEVPADL